MVKEGDLTRLSQGWHRFLILYERHVLAVS